jgi:hypothetical protein
VTQPHAHAVLEIATQWRHALLLYWKRWTEML